MKAGRLLQSAGDVCQAGLTWTEEEEAMLRRRRDAAMRKAIGF